jgi:hypothetical protein
MMSQTRLQPCRAIWRKTEGTVATHVHSRFQAERDLVLVRRKAEVSKAWIPCLHCLLWGASSFIHSLHLVSAVPKCSGTDNSKKEETSEKRKVT